MAGPNEPWSNRSPPPKTQRRSGWPLLVIGGIGVAALIAFLSSEYPDALATDDQQISLVHSVAWLVFIASGLAVGWRYRARAALKHAAIWVAVILVLVLAYSFRGDVAGLADRMASELVPDRGRTTESGEVVFAASKDGHHYVQAEVDGTGIRFMVDTGASLISLTERDARAVGFDIEALDYVLRMRTANGIAMAAPVRLKEVTIGPIRVRDVAASVNPSLQGTSLLGISFLDRLSSYRFEGDQLTFRP